MTGIVVGVDGSADSVKALRFGITEARLRQTGVRVVHALEVPTVYWPGLVALVGVATEEGNRVLNRAIADALGGEDPGVRLERAIVEASAGHALVQAAQDADLLVVGSRGLGGLPGLVLGSVSHVCTTHAPCPVVVVRGEAESLTLELDHDLAVTA